MGRESLVETLNWGAGIPGGWGCLYYVKEKVVLPVADLVGTTVQDLIAQPFARIKDLGNGRIELQGPLKLSTFHGSEALAKGVAAVFAMIIVGSGLTMMIPKEDMLKEEWTAKKVAAVVITLLAGVATFYFLGKTTLYNTRVEFFPPTTTFSQAQSRFGFAAPIRVNH